jgi:putative DNA primase/helicase
MWRRIHVIEFPRTFSESEMEVELTGTLIDELSGIFNWALEGYRRLRDQEFIFSKSLSMQKSKRIYKQKNSSVIDFIESHFVEILAANQSVPFKDMYEQYRSFCLREGIKQVISKKDFRSTIESEGYPIENSSKHANQLRICEPRIEILN